MTTKKKLIKEIKQTPWIRKHKIVSEEDSILTYSSTSDHISACTLSIHENTLGLVTHINLGFADIHATVPSYVCNIYPHEFDTIEGLMTHTKDREHTASRDLKHRYWIFCQKRRQVNIHFPILQTRY